MSDEIGPLLQEVLARQADHARYPVRQKSAKVCTHSGPRWRS